MAARGSHGDFGSTSSRGGRGGVPAGRSLGFTPAASRASGTARSQDTVPSGQSRLLELHEDAVRRRVAGVVPGMLLGADPADRARRDLDVDAVAAVADSAVERGEGVHDAVRVPVRVGLVAGAV